VHAPQNGGGSKLSTTKKHHKKSTTEGWTLEEEKVRKVLQRGLGRKVISVPNEELEETEQDEEDDNVEQDEFDIDIDDRLLDEESEDLEDNDLKILAEMEEDKDTPEQTNIPEWLQADGKLQGTAQELVKDVEKQKGSFFWNHALGIPKRTALESGDDAGTVAVAQLRGFKEVVQNWRERFNSDDELVDENVEERLERVHEIEDALLLNEDAKGAPNLKTKFGGYLKSKTRGAVSSFDAMNPVNNPMLQDPDTEAGQSYLTKTDKEMLRALRGDRLLRGSNILEVGRGKQEKLPVEKNSSESRYSYPGVSSSNSFVEFMEAFLGQESCTMRVFMVWATPSWGFTARHQRALESLFRLHRNACVAVFSETLEQNSFNSFVKQGYKVAVVRPDLQELLAQTPSEALAAEVAKWKENPLFHFHYSELLRLAALYKFGGVYLDTDMLVLRPLDSLRNTVGSEITSNGDLRLNGAFLAFDKSNLFLKKCMEEFTRTFNASSAEYNGADLLTRVANSTVDDMGSAWTRFPDLLKIQGPFTFFPLDSGGIAKFFAAPKDETQKQHQGQLLSRISDEAYTIHLWNSLTSNLVPETASLVGVLLNRTCLSKQGVL
jgi:lactosylceramide 4-alpha-galactosyltransferase